MAHNNIITQSALEPIKTWEAQIAENLVSHANATLSKAHGWELIVLPHPYYVAGNDVSVYQDSNGDLVGTYMVRLTSNNVSYYAPINISTLAGQDPLTGVQSTAGAVQGQGGTAWVTDFSTEAQANLIATITTLLLPHTLLSHWEAHTGAVYSILPQVVYDSAGHVVGNYVAKIVYKSQELLLPCDTRLGGPLQPPRNTVLTCDTPFVYIPGGAGNNCNVHFVATATGTLPITYLYEYSAASTGPWNPVTAPSFSPPGWGSIACTITGNLLNITSVNPGSDSTRYVYIRCTVTNAAGTGISNSIYFGAHDATGSWIVYAAHEQAPFSRSEMLRLYKLRLWSLKNHNADTAVYMGRVGNQLVRRMKDQGFDFTQLTPEIQGFLGGELPYEERFARFKTMVLRCFGEFWPDCPNELVQDGLNACHVDRR